MAQVTVEQLAETVGASVDRLLSQMKDAGLPHASADEAVSEEDKQTLLAHLKKSHGERAGAPKKITLKRKSVSTLRAGGAGKRTVNVEVRKKRTYVKREDLEDGTEAEAGADLEAADIVATADLTLETSGADTAPVSGDPSADNDDPEMLRQRAAARRKAEEQARQLELEAAAKARAEEAATPAARGRRVIRVCTNCGATAELHPEKPILVARSRSAREGAYRVDILYGTRTPLPTRSEIRDTSKRLDPSTDRLLLEKQSPPRRNAVKSQDVKTIAGLRCRA